MKFIEPMKMRLMLWVWNRIPTCAEMTRLSSLALDQPQSFTMRFKMWVHQLMCVWCRRYAEQLAFLRRAAPALQAKVEQALPLKLSDPARQRIAECIRAECRH